MPPGVATNTWNVPAECAGATTCNCFDDTNVVGSDVPALENFPVATATKPDPLIVTVLPPPVGPASGATPVTAGTGSKLYMSLLVATLVPAGVVTNMCTVFAA